MIFSADLMTLCRTFLSAPHQDALGEDTFDGCPVERHQQSSLPFFNCHCGVGRPGEVPTHMHPQMSAHFPYSMVKHKCYPIIRLILKTHTLDMLKDICQWLSTNHFIVSKNKTKKATTAFVVVGFSLDVGRFQSFFGLFIGL